MTAVDDVESEPEPGPGPGLEPGDGPSWIGALLQLERDGDSFVTGRPSARGGRIFGGLIAAQALAAAGATVGDDRAPHSLHAYFVRPGRPQVAVELEVERTRDGRSFTTRRVTARQGGEVILEMLTSFHRPEPGVDWSPPPPPMLALDETTELVMPAEMAARFEFRGQRPNPSGWAPLPYWIRTRAPVEDDPLVRACALAFMSDLGLMAAARPPGVSLWGMSGQAASLDHAIWFHRPFHPERWHRYHAGPVNSSDARGLAVGSIHDAADTLVATVTQEALFRT
jgi:acyl-CoA thioesterase II